MGYKASGGLFLEPETDTSTYTGTALSVDNDIADGTYYTPARAGTWSQHYSYGIDLGANADVVSLTVYCSVGAEGGTPNGWVSTGDAFSVYGASSGAASTWALIDTFSAPTQDHQGDQELEFTLVFSSTETYRYFKVVATDTDGCKVTTTSFGDQTTQIGEIEYDGDLDISCSTGTTEINGIAASINAAKIIVCDTGTVETNGVQATINATYLVGQTSAATTTISGVQGDVWELHYFDIGITAPAPNIEVTIQQEPEINVDITVPAPTVEGVIDCFDLNADITVPVPIVSGDIVQSVEINADIIVSMPSVTAGIVLGNDINIDIAAPAPTIEVSIAISSDIDADIIVSMPLVRAEITNSSDPSIILKHSRY